LNVDIPEPLDKKGKAKVAKKGKRRDAGAVVIGANVTGNGNTTSVSMGNVNVNHLFKGFN
jgi:hypothetical protein